MAFDENVPLASNQASADITAMNANATYLKDVFEAFVNAWSDSTATNIKPKIMGDADNDTLIQCEESADEDIIRFDIGGTEQINLTDGALLPTTDNDIDLGSGTYEFKDLYIDGVIYADQIQLGDSEILYFGALPDMRVLHDGTHGYIDAITGNFYIRTNTSETAILCEANSSVNLYHDNSFKLYTLSDGVGVVGALRLNETSTPTASENFGKIYTKSDNKLYFQDGAGSEHEIAFA